MESSWGLDKRQYLDPSIYAISLYRIIITNRDAINCSLSRCLSVEIAETIVTKQFVALRLTGGSNSGASFGELVNANYSTRDNCQHSMNSLCKSVRNGRINRRADTFSELQTPRQNDSRARFIRFDRSSAGYLLLRLQNCPPRRRVIT